MQMEIRRETWKRTNDRWLRERSKALEEIAHARGMEKKERQNDIFVSLEKWTFIAIYFDKAETGILSTESYIESADTYNETILK